MLSGNTVKGEIAYGVIAGAVWLMWVAVVVWAYMRSGHDVKETGPHAFGKDQVETSNSPDGFGNKETL